MKARFGDKESIQNGEKVPLGYYRHNGPSPIENTRRDFETASYTETTQIPPGIYPIYPGWSAYSGSGGEASLYVEFKSTVSHDFFPSSFGGVMIGDAKPKHVGEPRTVYKSVDLIDGIKRTGNSPNKTPNADGEISPDIYINPKCWEDIAKYYEEKLEKDLEYIEKCIKDFRSEPDNKESRTGTLRYCAGCIDRTSKILETVYHCQSYQKNPTFIKLHERNTEWIPKEAPVKVLKGKLTDGPEMM